MSGFCTQCGTRIETFEGLTECPSCHTTSIPCDDKNQVTVSINWRELQILCIWAEDWQRSMKLDNMVYPIANRLEEQYPDRSPLTSAKALGKLAEKKNIDITVSDPQLRQDIINQTGYEPGLLLNSNMDSYD